MFRIKATPTLVNSFMAKYNRVPRHRHDYEYLNCHNITLYGMNDNEEPSVLVVSKLIRNTSGILHVISQYLYANGNYDIDFIDEYLGNSLAISYLITDCIAFDDHHMWYKLSDSQKRRLANRVLFDGKLRDLSNNPVNIYEKHVQFWSLCAD